jgi:hypothetical protein
MSWKNFIPQHPHLQHLGPQRDQEPEIYSK